MSTFPLDKIDEHLLKQIVRKFTPTSGARFYRSCRGAKGLIDRVKPGKRGTYRSRNANFPNIPLEFCRIERVEVHYCQTNYINTVVLPEVAAVGGVGRLDIAGPTDSTVQLLIAAAKPETVKKNFGTIIMIQLLLSSRRHAKSYWRTTKLYELAKNRRSITLHLQDFSREIIASLIENWLKGEKTGTLERLTVILRDIIWSPGSDEESPRLTKVTS